MSNFPAFYERNRKWPIYRYGGHIESIRFNEYYGMPRGHEHDPFFRLVLVLWSFPVYFSGKRRSLLHPNTVQRSFFPLQSYYGKTLRKNAPKGARGNTKRVFRNVLTPHWVSHNHSLNLTNSIGPFIREKIRRVLNKTRTGPFIRACLI